MLATMPLGVIVLTFFLPMADACQKVVSPLTYVQGGGVGGAMWVLPTFVTAVLLAVAVVRRRAARAMRDAAKPQHELTIALWAMTAFVATLPLLAALFAFDSSWWMAPIYALATATASVLLVRAWRRRAHERVAALLDVYAVAALPLAVAIADIGKYVGAHLFIVAYVALATQRALLALQPRRSLARAEGRNVLHNNTSSVRVDVRLQTQSPSVDADADLIDDSDEATSLANRVRHAIAKR